MTAPTLLRRAGFDVADPAGYAATTRRLERLTAALEREVGSARLRGPSACLAAAWRSRPAGASCSSAVSADNAAAMRFGSRFVAVDWGTTNRRVFLIEDGVVRWREHQPQGVAAVARDAFPVEMRAIRDRAGDLPMLMAGMVGSTLGWRAAAYVPAPAGAADLARALLPIDDRTAIVPGVSTLAHGRGDVMRGEEVQVIGAVAAELAPPDAVVCQPGTHSKWVIVENGRIAGFSTAMTGELLALLRANSVLAPQLAAAATPGDAFLAGVAEGRRRDLAASLFAVRAAKLLGLRDDADAPSFVSGLLIGAELAARLAEVSSDAIYVVADPGLAGFYQTALEACGRRGVIVESETAFVAGIVEIGRHLS